MKLDSGISAVVTGGASGLGRAVARALAAAGVRVGILDRNRSLGATVATEVSCLFHEVDVTSAESVSAGFAAVRAVHGQERILVNCAGIARSAKTLTRDRATGALTTFPMTTFEQVLQVNLLGTFRCLTISVAGMATLAPLDDGERGVVINTSSIAATDGQVGQAAYAASKAAVVGLTLPVARDLAGEGIRINAIMPGVMETAMVGELPERVRAGLTEAATFPRRLGRPEEFASLALELIRNGYMNGEAIRLDAGMRMPMR